MIGASRIFLYGFIGTVSAVGFSAAPLSAQTTSPSSADVIPGNYIPTIDSTFTQIFSPTLPAPGGYMNDHTFIQSADGVWNIIGISGGGNGKEKSFASARGESLTDFPWTQGPVVSEYYAADGTALDAWAPSAFEKDGTTYLFYRSNRNGGNNTLAIDTSTDADLGTWKFQPNTSLTGKNLSFRDAMVTEVNGQYLMYATGREPETNRNYVALYESTDLLNWTEKAPALTLSGTATTVSWSSAESPYLFEYGGKYYLSVTITNSNQATYHDTFIFRSDDPTSFGDFNGVSATGGGTLVTKLPVHAPEYIKDPTTGQWYISTAGWRNMSLYEAAKTGPAIARLRFNPAP